MSDRLRIPREDVPCIKELFSAYAKICEHEANSIQTTLNLVGADFIGLWPEAIEPSAKGTINKDLEGYMLACKTTSGIAFKIISKLDIYSYNEDRFAIELTEFRVALIRKETLKAILPTKVCSRFSSSIASLNPEKH